MPVIIENLHLPDEPAFCLTDAILEQTDGFKSTCDAFLRIVSDYASGLSPKEYAVYKMWYDLDRKSMTPEERERRRRVFREKYYGQQID